MKIIRPRGLSRWSILGSSLLALNVSGATMIAVPPPPAGPSNLLAEVRDQVRAIRRERPDEAAEVVLPPGTYVLAEPLRFGPEDSGTAAAPVVWRAATPGTVRILAGREVGDFRPVTDPVLLERLPAEARPHVRVADLRAQGITDYGTMSGGFGRDGSTGLEVFVDDRPTTIARYPNEGFIKISELAGPTETRIRETVGCKEGWFHAEDERVKRWAGETGAMLHGYWYWDWADQRQAIESVDAASGLVKLVPPNHSFGYRKNQYFYGFNLLGEIDQPGEWYLDRENGWLYLWPPADLAEARVMVTLLPNLLVCDKAAHVAFRGLILEGSREHGIEMKNCRQVRLEACTVRNLGKWAVRIDGGSDCAVVGCDITGTGDGGIGLNGGDRKTLTPSRHLAENNHIHHYSRWNRMYRPAISFGGVGNIARHNLIHHAPHQAMGFGGNDHLIEYNEIHNVCEESNDAGAIYSCNDWAGRGHVIRYNHLHHIYGHENKGCVGVYLDDGFSSVHLHGNLFRQVPRAAFVGGGRDNFFENNLFVACQPALHIDARGLGWRAYGYDELRRKLELWPYQQEPWASRYPELVGILDDEPMIPKGNVVRRNVAVGGRWDSVEAKAKPHVALENNWVGDGNPGFVDLAALDLRILPGSAVAELGFAPIPLDRIGLRADLPRATWPVEHTVEVSELRRGGDSPRQPHPRQPVLAVRRGTPATDGVIGADEYPGEAAPVAETPGRAQVKDRPAALRVAYDDSCLYVAVRVFARGPLRLSEPPVWGQHDGLEVCLRVHGEKPGPTFVLHGFPGGTFASVTDAGAPNAQAETLGQGTRFAARGNDDGWTAEWAIPFAALGVQSQPGLTFGFNTGVNRTETGDWIIWAGALSQTWLLDNAGTLRLE
ncbi:MAG: right-handed parallel beta-helix repeat-containing protein [Lentisphaeria bacterium]|nr:right-handed parallel beta-helix repeat-containing protein [Lentisphaeria bacterium]